jgi:hypothetical protein
MMPLRKHYPGSREWDIEQAAVRSFRCPYCKAKPGNECKPRSGLYVDTYPHKARMDLAREADARAAELDARYDRDRSQAEADRYREALEKLVESLDWLARFGVLQTRKDQTASIRAVEDIARRALEGEGTSDE